MSRPFLPKDDHLNLASLQKSSLVSGPGYRDSIWLQGCKKRCVGCGNPAFLPFIKRRVLSVTSLINHFRARKDMIDGISVLGGEPIEQSPALEKLLRAIRLMGMTSVVYTGYRYEELLQSKNLAIHNLLKQTDLLIDGEFIKNRFRTNLRWRGSDNQRLLFLSDRISPANHMTEAIVAGEIQLHPDHLQLNGCVFGTIEQNSGGT